MAVSPSEVKELTIVVGDVEIRMKARHRRAETFGERDRYEWPVDDLEAARDALSQCIATVSTQKS